MPRFITFFSYTGASAKAMVDRPSDRAAAAKALTESLGGTLESFYWMHGKHDGFLITDLPDGATAASLALATASTGAITNVVTHEIFGADEQGAIVQGASTARNAYQPPSA
jgi:uncharacterized protein with GYD domain